MELQKLIIFLPSFLILNCCFIFCTISASEIKQEKTGRIFDFDLISQFFEETDDDSWENEKTVVVCKYPNCTIIVQQTNDTASKKCTFKDIQTQWSALNNLKYHIKSSWNDLIRNVDEETSNKIKIKALDMKLSNWNKKIAEVEYKIKTLTDKLKSGDAELTLLKASLEKEADAAKKKDFKKKINSKHLEIERNKLYLGQNNKKEEVLQNAKDRAKNLKTKLTERNDLLTKKSSDFVADITSNWKDIELNVMKIKSLCHNVEDKWNIISNNWNKFDRILQNIKTINANDPNPVNSNPWRDFDSSLDILIWSLTN